MVRIVIDILLAVGVIFTFIGVLGVQRMPDVFGRLQASTCIATLGNIGVALAGIVYTVSNHGEIMAYIRLGIILLLILCTTPSPTTPFAKRPTAPASSPPRTW